MGGGDMAVVYQNAFFGNLLTMARMTVTFWGSLVATNARRVKTYIDMCSGEIQYRSYAVKEQGTVLGAGGRGLQAGGCERDAWPDVGNLIAFLLWNFNDHGFDGLPYWCWPG
jgi:hypothetical protein